VFGFAVEFDAANRLAPDFILSTKVALESERAAADHQQAVDVGPIERF
jgi:hypothetical protein